MPFVDFLNMPWKPELKRSEDLPRHLREMILDQGSLTERLKQLHDGVFFVEVLNHYWGIPTVSEQCFLRCEDDRAIIREVLLYGSGSPVVFARSVLPKSSLQGGNRALLELGNKPLGEYIFNQPSLTRSPIEVAEIPAMQFNSYLDFNYQGESAWGRRSLFYLDGQPISVCEVFLPEKSSVTSL